MYLLLVLLFAASLADAAPSTAGAKCHRETYNRYSATPMARTSGVPSREDLSRATFTHAASGFRYRIYRTSGGLSFEFTKLGASLRGARELPFYIGSGATARSY